MREFPQWEADSLDSMGGTALSYATFLGGGDPNTITKAMLEVKGVSDAAVNNLGATLLHCAAGNPDARAGLMRTLLKRPGLKATVNMPMLPRNFKFRMVYRVSRFAVRAHDKGSACTRRGAFSCVASAPLLLLPHASRTQRSRAQCGWWCRRTGARASAAPPPPCIRLQDWGLV